MKREQPTRRLDGSYRPPPALREILPGGQLQPSSAALDQRIPVRNNRARRSAEAGTTASIAPSVLAGSSMFSEEAWMAIGRSLELSGRELQIVRGVFDDKKESTIAVDLSVSMHTVHTHVGRLHRKLHIADRAQLLELVMQEFLLLTASPGNDLPPICPNRARGRCPLQP